MSMMDFVNEHPDLTLAGGAVAVLLIGSQFLKGKTIAPGTATQDLSGLTNGIVYVPTQTSFTTNNRTQAGVFASNDPLLTGVTTGPVNSPTTTTTTGTPGPAGPPGPTGAPGRTGPPGPPVRQPPPPRPNPPPTHGKSLKWTSTHTFAGGETLSSVAAAQNRYNRGRNGMPEQYNIKWTDLWQHNQAVITKYANMHGHYRNVWDWVFPNETIVVPVWV